MIDLCNLFFSYRSLGFWGKKKEVLKNINLKINRGEFVGILGPSGCGKSTLAKILSGLQKPSNGEFFFGGKRVLLNNLRSRRSFYKDVQILFQDCIGSINPNLDIETFIMRACENLRCNYDRQSLEEVLRQLQIPSEILKRYSSTISGGQAARVVLARSLLVCPELLILDETTSSLDVDLQIEILKYLKSIQKEKELTIIFITHDIFLARLFCTRLVLMESGEIIEDINSNESFQSVLGRRFEEAISFKVLD